MEKEGIIYNLTYKNVKNINLRVKLDGTVHVSAHPHVPREKIDAFVAEKADFIERAREKIAARKDNAQVQYASETEIMERIRVFCAEIYPYYEEKGISFPQIRFRRMVSRWGSCHTQKGILTFNLYLMYAPPACTEYVVFHEFTHFLVSNHSPQFYDELQKVCPDWKNLRQRLRSIQIC